jgi:hypothetical protein
LKYCSNTKISKKKKQKKKPNQSNFCQKEDQPVSDQNFHKYFSNLDQDSINFQLKEDQANLDQDSINSQNIQKRIRNKKKDQKILLVPKTDTDRRKQSTGRAQEVFIATQES